MEWLDDWLEEFQSTLLMRGATGEPPPTWSPYLISIHAPHARSDCTAPPNPCPTGYFNPRSSCEERLPHHDLTPMIFIFQSTLLMRGATGTKTTDMIESKFQSTLLMRGATTAARCRTTTSRYFNPRSSCEERRRRPVDAWHADISIHAPHARSDDFSKSWEPGGKFQSTLLMRGATCHPFVKLAGIPYFNPRSSCEERLCQF